MTGRRGIALLLALVALILTALMSAGVLFATRTETRATAANWSALRSAEAAERGVAAAALSWTPESSVTMLAGARVGPLHASWSDSTTSTAWITRLGPGSFWVSASGHAGAARQRLTRHLGALHVLHLPQPPVRAAVSVHDSLVVSAGSVVDGSDTAPPWGAMCQPPAAAVPGAAAPDTSRVRGSGISGVPPIVSDSLAGHSTTLAQLGSVTWTSLAARAHARYTNAAVVTPGPRIAGNACDTSAADNWGDPARTTACANRFVIVHSGGDLVMDGGTGQGIILAGGNLELRNGARFYGLVLARGALRVLGGSETYGMLLSGSGAQTSGGARVHYSSCALEAAFLATAPLRRASSRPWAPLNP